MKSGKDLTDEHIEIINQIVDMLTKHLDTEILKLKPELQQPELRFHAIQAFVAHNIVGLSNNPKTTAEVVTKNIISIVNSMIH